MLTTPDVAVDVMKDADRARWRAFLERSRQGTFYHDPAFADVYARKTAQIANLIYTIDGAIAAVLPAGVVAAADGARELRSPFSASFAGFATDPALGLADALGIAAACERWARDQAVSRIVIQQPPAIYADPPDETIEFALRSSGFEQRACELSYYLTSLAAVDEVVRRNVRKAQAAGCAWSDADLRETWEFIAAIKSTRGQPFGIDCADLLAIAAAFPGAVRAFAVRLDGQPVAALIAYAMNRRVVLGLHWAQREDAQQHRPTDLLIHEAARWTFDGGFRAFDLGTTTIGGMPVWGVTRFKEKFSPSGAMRRQFVKELE